MSAFSTINHKNREVLRNVFLVDLHKYNAYTIKEITGARFF